MIERENRGGEREREILFQTTAVVTLNLPVMDSPTAVLPQFGQKYTKKFIEDRIAFPAGREQAGADNQSNAMKKYLSFRLRQRRT